LAVGAVIRCGGHGVGEQAPGEGAVHGNPIAIGVAAELEIPEGAESVAVDQCR
jgi:hypothetical protein